MEVINAQTAAYNKGRDLPPEKRKPMSDGNWLDPQTGLIWTTNDKNGKVVAATATNNNKQDPSPGNDYLTKEAIGKLNSGYFYTKQVWGNGLDEHGQDGSKFDWDDSYIVDKTSLTSKQIAQLNTQLANVGKKLSDKDVVVLHDKDNFMFNGMGEFCLTTTSNPNISLASNYQKVYGSSTTTKYTPQTPLNFK